MIRRDLNRLPAVAALDQAPLSEPLRALARQGDVCQWRKGMQITTEGDPADTLYIVLAGRLRSYSLGADEREITYAIYGPGDCVGDLTLDGSPRLASVQTLEPTVSVMVTRQTLHARVVADPALALELMAVLAGHVRQATLRLRQMALDDVYGRLRLLLEEVTLPRADGLREADPAPSHLEMSRRLGCSREMVSRVMKDLERGGYVRVGRRHVVLLRPLPVHW
jgi:CRP/FNR family cyclic AMP-dependent transcriptional regulator